MPASVRAAACVSCGCESEFWAWYGEPVRQTIDVEITADGTVSYDYTGITKSGEDAGEDDGFMCGNCGHYSDTIEELLGLPAPAKPSEPDPIELLYAIADDHEAAILDRLRERAGLTWECYGSETTPCRWTNIAAATSCERCGQQQPTSASAA